MQHHGLGLGFESIGPTLLKLQSTTASPLFYFYASSVHAHAHAPFSDLLQMVELTQSRLVSLRDVK